MNIESLIANNLQSIYPSYNIAMKGSMVFGSLVIVSFLLGSCGILFMMVSPAKYECLLGKYHKNLMIIIPSIFGLSLFSFIGFSGVNAGTVIEYARNKNASKFIEENKDYTISLKGKTKGGPVTCVLESKEKIEDGIVIEKKATILYLSWNEAVSLNKDNNAVAISMNN